MTQKKRAKLMFHRVERIHDQNLVPVSVSMVAYGHIVKEAVERNKFAVGDFVRTSLILRIDFEKGEIETLNTIYELVKE